MESKFDDKNPVSRILGATLGTLRRQLGKSVDTMHQATGLSPHSYRRVEAGRDPLHPKYVLRISAELRECRIDSARLAQVVAVVHDIEDKGSREVDDDVPAVNSNPGKESKRRVRYDRSYFRQLLKNLPEQALRAALAGMDSVSDEALTDETSKSAFRSAVSDLRLYLCPEQGSVSLGQETNTPRWLQTASAAISPIYMDIVLQQLERLADVQPSIHKRGLAAWERANERRFKRVFGLTRAPAVLRDSAHGREFDWGYVWRDSFEGVYVFADASPSDSQALEQELRASLLSRVRQRPGKIDDEYRRLLEMRVHVKSLSALPERLSSPLRLLLEPPQSSTGPALRNTAWSNAWFFEMVSSSFVFGYRDQVDSPEMDGLAETFGWEEVAVALDRLRSAWSAAVPIGFRA